MSAQALFQTTAFASFAYFCSNSPLLTSPEACSVVQTVGAALRQNATTPQRDSWVPRRMRIRRIVYRLCKNPRRGRLFQTRWQTVESQTEDTAATVGVLIADFSQHAGLTDPQIFKIKTARFMPAYLKSNALSVVTESGAVFFAKSWNLITQYLAAPNGNHWLETPRARVRSITS